MRKDTLAKAREVAALDAKGMRRRLIQGIGMRSRIAGTLRLRFDQRIAA